MNIRAGDEVEVTTASGGTAIMRALTGPTMGRDFTVIWVCTPEEYDDAMARDEEVSGIPWPVGAVRTLMGIDGRLLD